MRSISRGAFVALCGCREETHRSVIFQQRPEENAQELGLLFGEPLKG